VLIIGAAGVLGAAAELSSNTGASTTTIGLWTAVAVLAVAGAVIEYRRQRAASNGIALTSESAPSEPETSDGGYATEICQLPPDIVDFTGRDQLVAKVEGLVREQATGQAALTISAVAGKGGVGKTTLAVHVAHRLRQQFTDGQLYVNPRGAEARPLDPQAVLADFLRALGVHGASIPDNLDGRSRLYRLRLADKRMLVVLDNAADEAQVRPLLPGVSGCAVLVTSRKPLAGLEGARLLPLDVLDEQSAIALLAKIAGRARVAGEPEAARRIVRLCGYLPLAVRIAGGRLAVKTHWTLGRLVERLEDEHVRLTELHAGDLDVRASFVLSYSALQAAEQQAFRLLGLVQAQDFAAWPLAALLGGTIRRAEELIEELVDAQLLDVAGIDATECVRYRLHDLLRLFAGELASDITSADRDAAVERLGAACLALACAAEDRFQPGEVHVVDTATRWGSDQLEAELLKDPVAWFTVERRPLIAVVEQLHGLGLWELTWELAHTLAPFFEMRAHWEDWERTHALALEASRNAGSLLGEAAILFDLGALHRDRGNLPEALRSYRHARRNFRELQNRHGEAAVLLGMGIIHRNERQWEKAERELQAALRLFVGTGDRRLAAQARRSLGIVLGAQQEFEQAIGCFNAAGRAFRELGDRRAEAYNWRGLGDVYRDSHDWTLALDCYQQSLAMVRGLHDLRGEGRALQGIGRTHATQERHEEAVQQYEAALVIARGVGDRLLEASVLADLDQSRSARMTM
jgi:tetratricopeptide (TPR) repeat protein